MGEEVGLELRSGRGQERGTRNGNQQERTDKRNQASEHVTYLVS